MRSLRWSATVSTAGRMCNSIASGHSPPVPPRPSAQVYNGRLVRTLEDLDNPGVCPTSFTAPPAHYVLRTGAQPLVWTGYFVQNCAPHTLTPTPTAVPMEKVPSGAVSTLTLQQPGTGFVIESDVTVAGEARILVDTLTGNGAAVMTLLGTNTIGAATTGGMCPRERGRGASGQGRGGGGTPCQIQHSPNTPTAGLRERGNDTSKSTGRSGRQKAATPRNMQRGKRGTVQGPVKKQQPDGMSHRGIHCSK